MRRFSWSFDAPGTLPSPRQVAEGVVPCPFCGGEPAWEHHPEVFEIVRLSCADEACAIQPCTQFLLVEYAESLREAWNRRVPGGTHG